MVMSEYAGFVSVLIDNRMAERGIDTRTLAAPTDSTYEYIRKILTRGQFARRSSQKSCLGLSHCLTQHCRKQLQPTEHCTSWVTNCGCRQEKILRWRNYTSGHRT